MYKPNKQQVIDACGVVAVFTGFMLLPDAIKLQVMYLVSIVGLLKEWTKD